MTKLALEYLDEEARITVIELDGDGFVHLWHPSYSTKEFSGKQIYVSLVKEVISSDARDQHMYENIGGLKHDDYVWGYEMIEDLDPMRDPIGVHAFLTRNFELEKEHVILKGKNDALSANTV